VFAVYFAFEPKMSAAVAGSEVSQKVTEWLDWDKVCKVLDCLIEVEDIGILCFDK